MGGPGSGKPAGYGRMKGQSGATKKTSTSNSKKIAQSSSENTWKGSFRKQSNWSEWDETKEAKAIEKLYSSGKITDRERTDRQIAGYKKLQQKLPLSKSDFKNEVLERVIDSMKSKDTVKTHDFSDSEWDYIGETMKKYKKIMAQTQKNVPDDYVYDLSKEHALIDSAYNKYLEGYVKNGKKNGKKK